MFLLVVLLLCLLGPPCRVEPPVPIGVTFLQVLEQCGIWSTDTLEIVLWIVMSHVGLLLLANQRLNVVLALKPNRHTLTLPPPC